MKKTLLSLFGLAAWLILVNLFVATGSDFQELLSINEDTENKKTTDERLSVRNAVLNIGMKNQSVLMAVILILPLWGAYSTARACWRTAKVDKFGWFVFCYSSACWASLKFITLILEKRQIKYIRVVPRSNSHISIFKIHLLPNPFCETLCEDNDLYSPFENLMSDYQPNVKL